MLFLYWFLRARIAWVRCMHELNKYQFFFIISILFRYLLWFSKHCTPIQSLFAKKKKICKPCWFAMPIKLSVRSMTNFLKVQILETKYRFRAENKSNDVVFSLKFKFSCNFIIFCRCFCFCHWISLFKMFSFINNQFQNFIPIIFFVYCT